MRSAGVSGKEQAKQRRLEKVEQQKEKNRLYRENQWSLKDLNIEKLSRGVENASSMRRSSLKEDHTNSNEKPQLAEDEAFRELKRELSQQHVMTVKRNKELNKLHIQKERESLVLLASQSQRKIREGFTKYDIINYSCKKEYMPSKKESLGKVFDY